jgi:hypothetical protein
VWRAGGKTVFYSIFDGIIWNASTPNPAFRGAGLFATGGIWQEHPHFVVLTASTLLVEEALIGD